MHPLPIPSALATSDRAQDALDKALAALQWVMTQRPDRPTSIESVRRAATTVLTLATKLLSPPPRHLRAGAVNAASPRPTLAPPSPPPPLASPLVSPRAPSFPTAPPPSRAGLANQVQQPLPAPSKSEISNFKFSSFTSPSTPFTPPPAPIFAAYDRLPPAQALREKAGAAPPRTAGPPSIFADLSAPPFT